jgi:hypothetical protein
MNTYPAYPIQPPAPAPKKSNKTLIIILIIAVVLCCLCTILVVGGYAGYNYIQNNNTGTGSDSGFSLPSLQLPSLFGVQMGEEARCDKCGFSFKKIPGYDYKESWLGPTMIAPGGDEKNGPAVMLMGGVAAKDMNKEELMKRMITEQSGITYSTPKDIKVSGQDAISVEMEGTQDGVAVKGRMVSGLFNNQIFAILGLGPADKWEEIRPYFEGVMNSMSFFEPVPLPTETSQP